MKKLYILALIMVVALGARVVDDLLIEDLSNNVLDKIELRFKENLQNVKGKSLELKLAAKKYTSKEIELDELKSAISELRLAYKKVEHLFDYLEPELTAMYINGAPLPKLEKHIPEIVVVDPKGLQTLDELIYLSGEESGDEILKLSTEFENIWNDANAHLINKSLQHRFIIESIRYGVIRILALGLTGFDTPGSGLAMSESRISWESMQSDFQSYEELVPQSRGQYFSNVLSLFKIGGDLLNSTEDFTQFDHLEFARSVAEPLYRELLHFHKAMQIEFKKDVDPTSAAHVYESEHIFSEDFLNPSFYTQIAMSDLNDVNKIDLGRMLFFDPALSKELNMSCASCHDPFKGFSDGIPKSATNTTGEFLDRNAPTLLNASLYGRYFWDMREYDLERQIKHVVHNDKEFDMDFIELADRLKESSEYVDLFKEAFGDRDKYIISTWSISNALAAYITSLTSFNSSFDQYVRSETTDLDENIKRGYNLFMGKGACATCHFVPTFSGLVPPFYKDSESEVLGVTIAFDTMNPQLDMDPGRRYNGLPSEEADHLLFSFKTATVRNAELTAPYFHNGAFTSLDEVLHFYNHGGGAGMGLDLEHQTLPSDRLDLSKVEMNDIISFIHSLTDTVGMTRLPKRLPGFEKNPEWNDRFSY